MTNTRQAWWKIVLVTLGVAVLDVLGHALDGSPLPALAPSALARIIGTLPSAALFLIVMLGNIAGVFVLLEGRLEGGRIAKGLRFGLANALLLFLAVVEMHPVFGTPVWNDVRIGIADFVPVALLGLCLGWVAGTDSGRSPARKRGPSILGATVIALVFLGGRYFSYAVLGIESGYVVRPLATFIWTAGTALAVGLTYFLLGEGSRGSTAPARSLWFTCVVFGAAWTVYHLFMLFVYDVPAGPVLVRPALDMAFLFAGTLFAESRGAVAARRAAVASR